MSEQKILSTTRNVVQSRYWKKNKNAYCYLLLRIQVAKSLQTTSSHFLGVTIFASREIRLCPDCVGLHPSFSLSSPRLSRGSCALSRKSFKFFLLRDILLCSDACIFVLSVVVSCCWMFFVSWSFCYFIWVLQQISGSFFIRTLKFAHN